MDYDITLTGGLVVDGTGTPARRADVAITAGRIAAIGEGPFTARTTIDASGAVIAPGFVDLHSHADFTLPAHPAAETQLAQGVTTLIAGNCGHSPFPLPDPTQTELATVFTETPSPATGPTRADSARPSRPPARPSTSGCSSGTTRSAAVSSAPRTGRRRHPSWTRCAGSSGTRPARRVWWGSRRA
ncbi:amidohydrolase family protein [Prescottella equi]